MDDTGVLVVEWDNGITIYIESGWWQPHSDGQIASTQLYAQDGFASLFPTRVEKLTAVRDRTELDDGGFVYPRKQQATQSMYESQMKYFLDCIEGDKTPVPGGAEGLINMKVIDAAYRSAKSSKVIDL